MMARPDYGIDSPAIVAGILAAGILAAGVVARGLAAYHKPDRAARITTAPTSRPPSSTVSFQFP